jgi:cell division protein FtsI/penicillin-binding protein 2
VPGEPVHGKTGTAEYGSEDELGTHAWFIGWQGDIAFAVLVAETPDAFGGRVAAPIAADFLTRLAGS